MRWILAAAVLLGGCESIRAATNHPASPQQIQRFTPEEIEAQRQSRAAFAAGLAAFGSSLQRQEPATVTTGATQTAAPATCSSDYGCDYGSKCVKPNYSATGTCMQKVNEYGAPTYEPPAASSVGVKTPSPSDCAYSTQCPIGFHCFSGSCVK